MARPSIARSLDRPGGRAVLGALASVYLTASERRPCRVTYDDMWIHRHGSTVVTDVKLVLVPPEELDARVEEMFLTEYRPGPGDVVIDVGAGVGRETSLFSRLVGPTGRVFAIEAHPKTAAMLARAVELSGYENVTVLNAAIGPEEGTLVLTDDTDAHTRNRVISSGDGVSVEAITLDALCDRYSIEVIDLLKMNIEGAERPALEGMARSKAKIRNICIPCHDFIFEMTGEEHYRTKEAVTEFFESAGLTVTSRTADPRAHIRDVVFGHA